MCKCKKLLFFAIFLLLGDALGAITQNVALMKRRLDACMYPSITIIVFQNIGGIGNTRRVMSAIA